MEPSPNKITVYSGPNGAVIYVRMYENGDTVHWTTDEKFALYRHIRKEVPDECRLFNTRREMVKELATRNYFI